MGDAAAITTVVAFSFEELIVELDLLRDTKPKRPVDLGLVSAVDEDAVGVEGAEDLLKNRRNLVGDAPCPSVPPLDCAGTANGAGVDLLEVGAGVDGAASGGFAEEAVLEVVVLGVRVVGPGTEPAGPLMLDTEPLVALEPELGVNEQDTLHHADKYWCIG